MQIVLLFFWREHSVQFIRFNGRRARFRAMPRMFLIHHYRRSLRSCGLCPQDDPAVDTTALRAHAKIKFTFLLI